MLITYTVEEAARTLGVHKNTVRAWLKRGLPTIDAERPTLILGRELAHFRRASQRTHLARAGHQRIDIADVARRALPHAAALCARWLPDGRRIGREWVARNPRRADRRPGSFKVNLVTGRWCDFATGDAGGDIVSLAAFLFGLSQVESAWRINDMIGGGA
jgi:hypothetical protein